MAVSCKKRVPQVRRKRKIKRNLSNKQDIRTSITGNFGKEDEGVSEEIKELLQSIEGTLERIENMLHEIKREHTITEGCTSPNNFPKDYYKNATF